MWSATSALPTAAGCSSGLGDGGMEDGGNGDEGVGDGGMGARVADPPEGVTGETASGNR